MEVANVERQRKLAEIEANNARMAAENLQRDLAVAAKFQAIRNNARRLDYATIARDPTAYIGQTLAMRGKVVQVLQSGIDVTLRVNVTKDPRNDYWNDTVLVAYRRYTPDEKRFLDNDIIQFYGEYRGITEYKAVLGQPIQIPTIIASIVENETGAWSAPVINLPPPQPAPAAAGVQQPDARLIGFSGLSSRMDSDQTVLVSVTISNYNAVAIKNIVVFCGNKSYSVPDASGFVGQVVLPSQHLRVDGISMHPAKRYAPPDECRAATFEAAN